MTFTALMARPRPARPATRLAAAQHLVVEQLGKGEGLTRGFGLGVTLLHGPSA